MINDKNIIETLSFFSGASALSSVNQKLGGVLLLRVEGGDGADGMSKMCYIFKGV